MYQNIVIILFGLTIIALLPQFFKQDKVESIEEYGSEGYGK